MSREILYRAKRKDNGEWIEGYFCKKYFQEIPHDRYVIQYKTEYDPKLWKPDYMAEEVIPETVGQFTGLTDKNGKKIFEGDIVKDLSGSMDGIPRVVFYNEEWMEFETYLVKKHWAYGTNCCRLWCIKDKELEVIGNIHDNPELLGE